MAYTIQAFVAPTHIAAEGPAPCLSPVELEQEFALLPLSESVREALRIPNLPLIDDGDECRSVPEAIARLGVELSRAGEVAYIEAELFGGTGLQASIVWKHGVVVSHLEVGGHAINAALTILGVDAGTAHDEFDALGLGRHRWTDD